MVVAGVLAAVVLSVIAVLVGGIFQVTSRWLAPCPADLSVNDPAPILWKSIESDQSPPAAPGVPKELAEQVGWKGSPPGGK
jgi:hypothetical protein